MLLKGAMLLVFLLTANSVLAHTFTPLQSIDSPLPEYGFSRGPDGWYFSRSESAFGKPGREMILRFDSETGNTESPSFASSNYSEGDPWYSAALQRLCYTSNRPHELSVGSAEAEKQDSDIWCVQYLGGEWQNPQPLPAPVNSAATEFSPVLTPEGSVYFASDRPGGMGMGDIWMASPLTEGTWTVENLGPAVNSAYGEWNLEMSPDGSWLIFEASHRASNLGVPGDLYISHRTAEGWSPAVPLSLLNTPGSDLMPRFHNANELLYSSRRGEDLELRNVSFDSVLPVEPLLAAMSRSAHELVLLDPATLEIRKRIGTGQGSHEIASSLDGRVALLPSLGVFPRPHEQAIKPEELRWEESASDGLLVADLLTGTTRQLPLQNCARPHGAAISAQADRGWVTCEDVGEIREIDPRTGETLHTWKLSEGVHKVMYLPEQNRLAASNPDTGEVYVIDLADRAVVRISTGAGAEALAASSDEEQLWVANGFAKTLCLITTATGQLEGCWPTGGAFPIALAVDEPRGVVWIARSASSDLAAFSLQRHELVREIPLPSPPLGMALDARSGRLYLTLPRLNEIMVMDAASGELIQRTSGVMEGDDLDLIPAPVFEAAPDT